MFSSIDITHFGSFLKSLRLKNKITQKYITDTTGINEDTIRRIESGAVIPKYETLAILSTVYKIDLVRKFTEIKGEQTLTSMYSKIDNALLSNGKTELIDISCKLNDQRIYDKITSTLINKYEIKQFEIYLDVLIEHFENPNSNLPLSIEKLQIALLITNPNFSSNCIDKFIYNTFEIRILILYAILWSKNQHYKLSNQILTYILEQLSFVFVDATTHLKYLIKLHFNISYNYHMMDLHNESLEHSIQGLNIGLENQLYCDLHTLYYRKFTAEYYLKKPEHLISLKKCIMHMELFDNNNLLDEYIKITKKIYNIDASVYLSTIEN